MERLTYKHDDNWCINGLNGKLIGDKYANYWGEAVNRLAYYEELEEQGRLIVHPCKKGDTVYVIDWYEDCDIDGYGVCDEYEKYEEACMFCSHNVTKKFIREDKYANHNLEDFGRRWFITREEAEAAIERK